MAKQNKQPNLDETKEKQPPQGDEGAGLEKQEGNGGVDSQEQKEEQTKTEVKHFKTKRPLLHNGKTYSVGDDVTGVFDDEELGRLLGMDAIVEA